jgi:hypothetical protein
MISDGIIYQEVSYCHESTEFPISRTHGIGFFKKPFGESTLAISYFVYIGTIQEYLQNTEKLEKNILFGCGLSPEYKIFQGMKEKLSSKTAYSTDIKDQN